MIQIQFCDGSGNCSGQLPGTRRVHQYLHDNMEWYRVWHHSVFRIPTHVAMVALLIGLGSAGILLPLQSQNPQAAVGIFAQLPFQGRLTNTDGTVVADGSYDAVMQLYTQDTGGAPVWTENHTGADQITTLDGIFSTTLGSLTSLAGIDFNQDEYWLGITVGADAEMTPRIRLGAAPYAFNTDKLDGVSAEAFLQLPGQAGGQTAYGGTAASQNLVLRSTSHATKGDILLVDDGGDVIVGTAGNGSLSVPGTAGSSEKFGAGASATSIGATAIGAGAVSGGVAGFGTAVGIGSLASETEATAIGAVSKATGHHSTALGSRAEATALHSLAIGDRSVADEANSLVIGDNFEAGYDTRNVYIGYGRVSSFAPGSAVTFNATGGLGTNISGADLQLAGGMGTGNSSGGSVKIKTAPAGSSGSSLNALVERLTLTDTGNIVPGTGALSTSATDGFLYLASMPGSPSGTPSAFAGRVPLAYDSVANTLYTYNSGWQALGGGGGGITGSGAAGRVTVWNGASSVTSDAEYLWDTTTNRLRIGDTAAGVANSGSGSLNLANSGLINWRNAANSADRYFALDSNDDFQFQADGGGVTTFTVDPNAGLRTFQIANTGGGVSNLEIEGALKVYNTDSFGGSGIATSGEVRLQNSGLVTWRNAGNTADKYIALDGSDDYQFANDGTGVVTLAVDPNAAERHFQIYNGGGGVAALQVEGSLKVYNTNGFGGSGLAQSGEIRLNNSGLLTWRNAANSADKYLTLDSSDDYQFVNDGTGVVTLAVDPNAAERHFQIYNGGGGVAALQVEGSLKVYNSNGFSSSIADAGDVRLQNGAQIAWRNASNSGNRTFGLDASDFFQFQYDGSLVVTLATTSNAATTTFSLVNPGGGVANLSIEGDYYDTTIPSSVSSTTLCISGGGQIGTCTSDARLKTNIQNIGSGLDIIEQLSPKTFDFISGQTNQSGLLAQEVQQVLPGAVTKNTGDDYLSLNYSNITAYMVKAIQELNSSIEDIQVSDSSDLRHITSERIETGRLKVTGSTELATLTVNDGATIRGTLVVDQVLTANDNLIVKKDLQVEGAILGSKHTRGIDIVVPKDALELEINDLEFEDDEPYAVSVTPSWITDVAVSEKTGKSFMIRFAQPAPANATLDYFIQR